MLNSNDKGAIAEQEIMCQAVRLGVPVLKPVAEHGRVDLAFDIAGRIWRIQCKWGALAPEGDVIMARVGTSRCTPNGYVRTTYSEQEVDLFGIYCGDLDRCFLVPIAVVNGKHYLHLRVTPPLNGQLACINLAANFEFEGAIAQLGERSAGSRKVVGSNPTSSTASDEPLVVGSNPFRDRLGGGWNRRPRARRSSSPTVAVPGSGWSRRILR